MADAPEWRLRTRALPLTRPLLVGVVNVTPDSFSDGGRHFERDSAIEHGRSLVAAGADIVDVGGESTRPGAEPVEVEAELERVVPVVEALAADGLTVSVDTAKVEVAAAALAAGAEIVNDTTAASAEGMAELLAETGAGLVLMHMKGTPRTMQDDPRYDNVVADVRRFLIERAATVEAAGVERSAIAIDPGIGFGKTTAHNLTLLRNLGDLVATGYPVMVGASRKAFLGRILDQPDPLQRDVATAAVTALAVAAGVSLVRVHDVAASRQAAAVAHAVATSAT